MPQFADSTQFDRFIRTVFNPRPEDRVLLATDMPTADHPATDDWLARHRMTESWQQRLLAMSRQVGFEVLPVLTFPATGHSNNMFPKTGWMAGQQVDVLDTLESASLVLCMSEYSMTGGLAAVAKTKGTAAAFRAASMPLARHDMEATCFDVDYDRLRQTCQKLRAALEGAHLVRVRFSGDHDCTFDVRHRAPGVDDGYLHADKQGFSLINLPSGEVFISPYEGELPGVDSLTSGIIPAADEAGRVALFRVERNTITDVSGDPDAAKHFSDLFDLDPARRNVGEIAFGCNPGARLSGLFIEEEKAGFHWGFGRSEFLGGRWGPEKFRTPETVMHHDFPCANGMPVTVLSADVEYPDRPSTPLIRGGKYVL